MDLVKYFDSALSYEEYIKLLGDNLQLHALHYKKFILDVDDQGIIEKFNPIKILVITEPWCGDSLAVVPIVRKISEANEKWEMKVVLRDRNPDLMDQFLTNGGRAIPIFLFFNEIGKLIFKWGPRPKVAAEIMDKHRQLIKEGKIEKSEVIKKIRYFYSKDKGKQTLSELMKVFDKYLS